MVGAHELPQRLGDAAIETLWFLLVRVDEVSVRRGNPHTPCVAAFVGEGLAATLIPMPVG